MILSYHDIQFLATVAKSAAINASDYILKSSRKSSDITFKKAGDSLASQVVSKIDINSQNIILKSLEEASVTFDIGLLTEEEIDNGSRFIKDYFWCIDPLDGTLPFSQGETGYAVSIALVSRSGESILGVVAIPDKDEIYVGVKRDGMLLNGTKWKRNILDQNVFQVYVDFSLFNSKHYEQVKKILRALPVGQSKTAFIVGQGAVKNAIDVMNAPLACYFKFPKKEVGGGSIWDFAATDCLFNCMDTGVKPTDIFGKPLDLNSMNSAFMNEKGVVYASNEGIHKEVMALYDAWKFKML